MIRRVYPSRSPGASPALLEARTQSTSPPAVDPSSSVKGGREGLAPLSTPIRWQANRVGVGADTPPPTCFSPAAAHFVHSPATIRSKPFSDDVSIPTAFSSNIPHPTVSRTAGRRITAPHPSSFARTPPFQRITTTDECVTATKGLAPSRGGGGGGGGRRGRGGGGESNGFQPFGMSIVSREAKVQHQRQRQRRRRSVGNAPKSECYRSALCHKLNPDGSKRWLGNATSVSTSKTPWTLSPSFNSTTFQLRRVASWSSGEEEGFGLTGSNGNSSNNNSNNKNTTTSTTSNSNNNNKNSCRRGSMIKIELKADLAQRWLSLEGQWRSRHLSERELDADAFSGKGFGLMDLDAGPASCFTTTKPRRNADDTDVSTATTTTANAVDGADAAETATSFRVRDVHSYIVEFETRFRGAMDHVRRHNSNFRLGRRGTEQRGDFFAGLQRVGLCEHCHLDTDHAEVGSLFEEVEFFTPLWSIVPRPTRTLPCAFSLCISCRDAFADCPLSPAQQLLQWREEKRQRDEEKERRTLVRAEAAMRFQKEVEGWKKALRQAGEVDETKKGQGVSNLRGGKHEG